MEALLNETFGTPDGYAILISTLVRGDVHRQEQHRGGRVSPGTCWTTAACLPKVSAQTVGAEEREETGQFGDVSLAMWRTTNSPAKLPFIVDAEHESLAGISP